MREVTVETRAKGIQLEDDDDGHIVFVYAEDYDELIDIMVKHKEELAKANKVSDVTIKNEHSHCVMIQQDFDHDVVQVSRDELPKLIKLLQDIVDKG